MKKMLLVLGGSRVGDIFHLIPFFEEHQEYLIDWVTGSYEQTAVRLIQMIYPNIIDVQIEDDGFPGNLRDREEFVRKYGNVLDRSKFEKVVDDPTVSFDLKPNGYELKDSYVQWERTKGNYICYHLDTISDWKRHSEIRNLMVDYPGYSLGKKGDFVLPGTIDYTGRPFKNVVDLICGCKMFVGIHSALACLTFYINKPSVIIHPMPNLLTFGTYREQFIDLVKPSTGELKKVILERLEK